MFDKCFYDGLVVFGILASEAVGNDGADGSSLVAEKEREAVDARALHLVVRDAAAIESESRDTLIEVGRSEGEADYPTLRAVEAWGRYCGADVDAGVGAEPVDELAGGVDYVGFGEEWIPIDERLEGVFEIEVGNIVASGIVVEDAVEADGCFGEKPRIDGEVGLKGA